MGPALDVLNHIVAFNSNFIPAYTERMFTLLEMASWDHMLESAQKLGGIVTDDLDSVFGIALHELVREGPTNAVASYLELVDKVF